MLFLLVFAFALEDFYYLTLNAYSTSIPELLYLTLPASSFLFGSGLQLFQVLCSQA